MSNSPVVLGHPLPDYEEKAALRRTVTRINNENVVLLQVNSELKERIKELEKEIESLTQWIGGE